MSERAEDDVRAEPRRAGRQLKQRGGSSAAMAAAAAAEQQQQQQQRRSLPSPEAVFGQPWASWVDASKLHGNDGADSEESFKDFGRNREAMRLCREDMPIFGQCPAQDDFYLVMCSHCSQVVKPQAFQAHYERRHSLASKPTPILGRASAVGPSVSNSKLLKPAKEKRKPPFLPFRVLQPDKILTPAVKVEKIHLKVDPSTKLPQAPSAMATASTTTISSSGTTVSSNTATVTSSSSSSSSSSALKPGLNCPSIPKPPLLAPGQIPNGRGHASVLLEKKQESSSSRRSLYKRLSEREFNPDIHCGVVDMTARKPCTRSLTCKTHSLSQRRAVSGRRKRFDALLTEHKGRARDRERDHPHAQQTPPLREPHPSSRLVAATTHDPHLAAHGNGPATAEVTTKSPAKPRPHTAGQPRVNSSHGAGPPPGEPAVVHDAPHQPPSAPDSLSRPSSDDGENEVGEENADRLDCHYSGYHPRPAAYCTFGSRLFGRGSHTFDRRWDRMRCALTAMMDKHVNSQMWKKIPLALENSSSSSLAPAHRTSTNSHGSTSSSSGFLSPSGTQAPYGQSCEGKSALSYGTTLNARASPQGGAEHPAYGTTQARQVSSLPQMPSAHSSSPLAPPPVSGRALKSRSSSSSGGGGATKAASFRPRESSSGPPSSTPVTPSSLGGGGNSTSSNTSFSSGKKRKNSSFPAPSHGPSSDSSSSSNANYSSSSSSFKKNCANAQGSSGSNYHHSSLAPASSSSSHSGVHSVGLNCGPTVRTNSLSLKAEPSGGPAGGSSSGPSPRGPPSGSPAESIKRMSVVMNSSDSTLSLGPFVHHHHHHQSSSEHHAGFGHHASDGRLDGKKRKSSPASSGGGGGGGGVGGPGVTGGGGGGGPGRPKVAKSPSINNIHGKHGRSVPGGPALPNNSHLHQPKARP
ncbi:unnamed protein product [Merluccius merluccius]